MSVPSYRKGRNMMQKANQSNSEPIADSYGEEVNGQRKDDLNAKMDINEEIAHQAGTPVENGSTVC